MVSIKILETPHVILEKKSFPVWLAHGSLNFSHLACSFVSSVKKTKAQPVNKSLKARKVSTELLMDFSYTPQWRTSQERFVSCQGKHEAILVFSIDSGDSWDGWHWPQTNSSPHDATRTHAHTPSKTRLKKNSDENPWARSVTLQISLGFF